MRGKSLKYFTVHVYYTFRLCHLRCSEQPEAQRWLDVSSRVQVAIVTRFACFKHYTNKFEGYQYNINATSHNSAGKFTDESFCDV